MIVPLWENPKVVAFRKNLSPEEATGERSFSIDTTDEGGVDCRTLVFNMDQVRRIFSYRYIKEGQDQLDAPDMIVDWKLQINYCCGKLEPAAEVSMDIVLPHRLGQKMLYGMDISPGAKTYVEMLFERESLPEGAFRLMEIQVGRKHLSLRDRGGDLVKQVEVPFPFPDRFDERPPAFFGPFCWSVPLLLNEGEMHHVSFPEVLQGRGRL